MICEAELQVLAYLKSIIAGRATAAPRGGRTSGRTSRGGGRTRGRSGDQGNGRIDGQGGQVGGQGSVVNGQGGQVGGQGSVVNDGVDEVPNFSTIIVQEAAVGMSWEDFKNLTREEFCPLETIQRAIQKAKTLTDKAVRNGSLKKNPKKRRNSGEPNRDRNMRDENKRTRNGNTFATTTNLMRREYNDTIPKCVNCNLHHPLEMPCWSCFNCGRPRHMAKDYRVATRMVTPLNARNPTAAPGACYECGGTDHFKATCPRHGLVTKNKAEIVCHEKIVRIPLQDDQVLRVIRERPEEKMRHLMSAKANEQKQEDIVVVKDFPEERVFQSLKDKLCNAPVLVLSNGPKDFVVYYDASGLGLGCVLMQRELCSDYDCEIRYHPGKVNVVANALSRKERIKPRRIRAMHMTLQSSIKDRILAAREEASDKSARLQRGLDELIERRSDRALYYLDRIWVSLKGDVRTLIIDEAHKSKYSVHPGADKMYYDLRDRYWWPGMKKEIPECKWEKIAMDFVTKLPRTRLEDRWLARLYLNEIVARHDMPISIISNHDSRFTSRFLQAMQEAIGTRACVLDVGGSWDVNLPLVEFLYYNSYHSSVKCALFEALYGRKCCSLIMWVEVREGHLIGPELVQETTEKIS
nr:hypothetical protein [Tanacetum cinerariifolium]